MHGNQGSFTVTWNMYQIPDTMDVYYGGTLLYSTGLISGTGQTTLSFGPGQSSLVRVVMNQGGNTDPGTLWTYTVRFTGNGDIQLTDSNDGSTIADGDTAWITGDYPPLMPALLATVSASQSGLVAWQLEVSWTRAGSHTVNKKSVAFSENYDETFNGTTELGVAWDIGSLLAGNPGGFFGGNARLQAILPDGTVRTLDFTILGDNPYPSDVLDYAATGPWFMPAIIAAESGTTVQFDNSGYPLFGPPDGWGVCQVEGQEPRPALPPNHSLASGVIWNWENNVDAAIALLRSKRGTALSYFNAVAAAYPAKYVAPPTFPGTQLSALDATTICLYNGAAGTLSVTLPGKRPKRFPYLFDPNTQTWYTQDNSHDYIATVWAKIQQLNLAP